MIFAAILVTIEILILISTVRKTGLYPFPHGNMVYIIGAHLALTAVATGLADYEFLRVYSTYTFFEHVNELNLILFAYFLTLYASIPRESSRVDLYKTISIELKKVFEGKSGQTIVSIMLFGFYFHLAFLIFNLKWDLVWLNEEYLLMNDAAILTNPSSLASFALQINKLVAVISVIVFAYQMAMKSYFYALALLPVVIFQFIYQLAGHSRSAVLYMGVFAIIYYIFNRSKLRLIISALASLVVLNFCLFGRGSGIHGISSILDFFDIVGEEPIQRTSFVLINIFEGVFVLSEFYEFDPEFSFRYKLLSFSPFPNAIDGFAAINQTDSVRLHDFVPPSSILEAIEFGPLYLCLFILIQYWVGLNSVRFLSKRGDVTSLFCNILMFFTVYLSFAYPIRNTFRSYLIVMVIIIISEALESKKIANGKSKKYSKNTTSAKFGNVGVADKINDLPPAVIRRMAKLQSIKSERENL